MVLAAKHWTSIGWSICAVPFFKVVVAITPCTEDKWLLLQTTYPDPVAHKVDDHIAKARNHWCLPSQRASGAFSLTGRISTSSVWDLESKSSWSYSAKRHRSCFPTVPALETASCFPTAPALETVVLLNTRRLQCILPATTCSTFPCQAFPSAIPGFWTRLNYYKHSKTTTIFVNDPRIPSSTLPQSWDYSFHSWKKRLTDQVSSKLVKNWPCCCSRPSLYL
jgi:hypothetical protein